MTTFRYSTSTLTGTDMDNISGFIPDTGVVGCCSDGNLLLVPNGSTINTSYLAYGGDDAGQEVDGAYGESVVINFKNLENSGILDSKATQNIIVAELYSGWESQEGTYAPYEINIKYETFIGGVISAYTTPEGVITNRWVSNGTVVTNPTLSPDITNINALCCRGIQPAVINGPFKRHMASITYNRTTGAATITFMSYPPPP